MQEVEDSSSNIPKSLGSDSESVKWINGCLEKVYTDENVVKKLLEIWNEALNDFINKLDIPDSAKKELQALTPATYIGNAAKKAKEI